MSTSYLDKTGLTHFWQKVSAEMKKRMGFYSDTTANWNASSDLVSEANMMYIYTDYRTIPGDNGGTVNVAGMKIGDGVTYLIDLPFVATDDEEILAHMNNNIIHVTQADRNFWNNKAATYIDPQDSENVIFTIGIIPS